MQKTIPAVENQKHKILMAIKFYSLSALLTRSLNSTTNKFPRAEEIEPMNSQLAARSLQLKHLEFIGLNEQV